MGSQRAMTPDVAGWRRLRHSRVGSVLLSIDFMVAILLAPAAALLPARSALVAAAVPAVMFTIVGVGSAVFGLTLAAMTFVSFLADPAYLRILKSMPGGLSGVRQPYLIVARVSASAVILGLAGALAWPLAVAEAGWIRGVICGAVFFPAIWSLIGGVQLVELSGFHMGGRERLVGLIDELRRAREAS